MSVKAKRHVVHHRRKRHVIHHRHHRRHVHHHHRRRARRHTKSGASLAEARSYIADIYNSRAADLGILNNFNSLNDWLPVCAAEAVASSWLLSSGRTVTPGAIWALHEGGGGDLEGAELTDILDALLGLGLAGIRPAAVEHLCWPPAASPDHPMVPPISGMHPLGRECSPAPSDGGLAWPGASPAAGLQPGTVALVGWPGGLHAVTIITPTAWLSWGQVLRPFGTIKEAYTIRW